MTVTRPSVRRTSAGLQRHPALAAALIYAVIDIAYFGVHVLPHLGRVCACGPGADPTTYMWFLSWWPHALLHGINPFVTHALFAPDRVNLGAVDVVPGPAIVGAPITLLFGPFVTYNVWALAGPPLAALTAYRLCHYITKRVAPALIGGYIYGFSPYMLGHMIGHLDLVTTFPIPICVLLVLRMIDGQIGRRTFIGLMTLTLSFQFLTQAELTLTLVVLGGCALAVAAALFPEARDRIRAATPPLLLAGALATLVTSAFIYEALTGPSSSGFFNGYSETYVADGLGFLVPTEVMRVGREWFHSVAALYTGNIAEDGVYVGVVLVAIVARQLVTRWGDASSRFLAVMLGLVVLLMLGPHLHVDGHQTVPLPWLALQHLPLVRRVAPVRLGVYMYLLVAIVATLWLSRDRSGWRGVAKWSAALLAVVMLVPNIGSGLWRNRLPNPSLFTTSGYRAAVTPGATVLALPFADVGQSMLWQAETGFDFKMADGYVGALAPLDYAQALGSPPLSAFGVVPTAAALGHFLRARGVQVVLVNAAEPASWPAVLGALGLHSRLLDGVLVYDVTTVRS